ncbi:hypothetical protein ACYZTX_15650 [Pseudomonas sp. MDT1-17]
MKLENIYRGLNESTNVRVCIAPIFSTWLVIALSACTPMAEGKKAGQQPDSSTPTSEASTGASPGNAQAGRDVFRFETFGNEGFWTDAMRLPQGMMQEKVTLLQLLETGFHIDAGALDENLQRTLAQEFKTDLSAAKATRLHDPAVALKVIEANALIGVAAKDSNNDGKIDLRRGDKIGVTCAICHTITDGSVAAMAGKGSIGRRLDGLGTFSLDMGKALAMSANSRAYYPNLQLELGGETIGRAPKGIGRDSTEAEVDAYLKNSEFYPRGTFDETADGIGNPVQNTPLFRQDLAGPYGSNGLHEKLEGISNASYTTNLDLTTLATPQGRELLMLLAGKKGEELHANYVQILKETGVTGYPFIKASSGHKAGHRDTPSGRQVDMQKLLDLKAYLHALPAPKGATVDTSMAGRGRTLFQENCIQCHNADQNRHVATKLINLKQLWPAYDPVTLAQRKPPLSPIENSPGGYDDKMVIIDASERGAPRGLALPLLLDLARKPAYLHDNSVVSLDALLDPKRGSREPHPFYVAKPAQRADMVEFLRGLDTTSK